MRSCGTSKSPGPDGFNFHFLKEFWEVYKADFMRLMEEFYENGRLVKGVNESFIVLIPKKEETRELSDFIPISLIGRFTKLYPRSSREGSTKLWSF